MLMVTFPSNIQLYYSEVKSIINFEIVPKDEIYDNIIQPLFFSETSDEMKEEALLL